MNHLRHIFFTYKSIWDKYKADEISIYAAQASFFLVISFFPLIMLLLTLIQFIPTISKSDLLTILVRLTPTVLDSLMVSIVEDLYIKSPATILSVTALLALWSASRATMGIENGLNRIHGSSDSRNYFIRRLLCSFYTLLFLLVCVFSMSILVFGTSIQNFLHRTFPVISAAMERLISIRSLLAITLFPLCFAGLYTVLPRKRLSPKHQLPGAIFTSVCWILFSYGFSLYFEHFSNYSYMYGSLTAIVLLMLWLYASICILFLGAEINWFLMEDGE